MANAAHESSNAPERVPVAAQQQPGPTPGPRHIDSHSLFGAAREVLITHHGESYCLRITRHGKLILTK